MANVLQTIEQDLVEGWQLVEGEAKTLGGELLADAEAAAAKIWAIFKPIVVGLPATAAKILLDALTAAMIDLGTGNIGGAITAALSAITQDAANFWVNTLDPALLQIYALIAQFSLTASQTVTGSTGATGATGPAGATGATGAIPNA